MYEIFCSHDYGSNSFYAKDKTNAQTLFSLVKSSSVYSYVVIYEITENHNVVEEWSDAE